MISFTHPSRLPWVLCLFLATFSARAQQHRATHLGNPQTRFAPPLRTADDLRARFRDPRLIPDIRSILQQWGWSGRVDDLLNAAATSRVAAVQIKPGTRLPFMSSRRNGKPIVLRDVLWDGREPVDAYAFTFASNGRRYRCLTPKPCSNFLVIDLGPVRPELTLELTATAEAVLCEPFLVRTLVRNSGHAPLTRVEITGALPPNLRTSDGRGDLRIPVGTLRPGEVRVLPHPLTPVAGGRCELKLKATSAEGLSDDASRSIVFRGPSLVLECGAPPEIPIGRTAEICVSLRNTGNGPEPEASVSLEVPAGVSILSASDGGVIGSAGVQWTLGRLDAGANRKVCVRFSRSEPGPVALNASARGTCAEPVFTACETRVAGVPGILLEVVDVEDPVQVGGEVIYEIRVTNQGSAPLTGVQASCLIPEIQEFVSASGPAREDTGAGTLQMEPVAVLDAKATVSWRVIMRAAARGHASFRVNLTCDQLPRAVRESETTNQY